MGYRIKSYRWVLAVCAVVSLLSGSRAITGNGNPEDSPFYNPRAQNDPSYREEDEVIQASSDPLTLAVRLVRHLGGTTALINDLTGDPIFTRVLQPISEAQAELSKPVGQRRADWEAYTQGLYERAAEVTTEYSNYLNITVKNFFKPLTLRDPDPNAPLNDATMLLIGLTRDEVDFRQALHTEVLYVHDLRNALLAGKGVPAMNYASNDAPTKLEQSHVDLNAVLMAEPQVVVANYPLPAEPAGILTTRAWAVLGYSQGTNRRAVSHLLQNFLCTPVENLRDPGMDQSYITRDVVRNPGGDTAKFLGCVGCHAGMDAFRGALAFLDFTQNDVTDIKKGGVFHSTQPNVAAKINDTNNNEGLPISPIYNASWRNVYTKDSQRAYMGWPEDLPGEGVGARSLGLYLSHSRAFAACMPRRALAYQCNMSPERVPASAVDSLTQRFINSGYNMNRLMQWAAIDPHCLGR